MKQALPSDVIRGASDAGVPELIQDLEPQWSFYLSMDCRVRPGNDERG
jgi:hypothetical protein